LVGVYIAYSGTNEIEVFHAISACNRIWDVYPHPDLPGTHELRGSCGDLYERGRPDQYADEDFAGEITMPRNECASCGEVFSSVSWFDLHRIGDHAKKTRRCLSINEIKALGMIKDGKGCWKKDQGEKPKYWKKVGNDQKDHAVALQGDDDASHCEE
jgi:hypothetical protein